jgi:hypothetical protein
VKTLFVWPEGKRHVGLPEENMTFVLPEVDCLDDLKRKDPLDVLPVGWRIRLK